MRKILITFLAVIASFAFASQFKLIEFREIPSDFQAQREPVTDMDMNYCAVIRVQTDTDIQPQIKQKVYKKDKHASGDNYFYISAKEKEITFIAPDYKPITVNQKLEAGKVYLTRLETIPQIQLTLIIEPQPDRIIIGDRIFETTKIELLPGSYPLTIEKEGYKTIEDTLNLISMNNNYSYELNKFEVKTEKNSIPTVQEKKTVSTTNNANLPKQTLFDFDFTIASIEQSSNRVIIRMNIENLIEDREMDIHRSYYRPHTKFYDQDGNEFFVDTIKFANKSERKHLSHRLLKNVPTKVELIFFPVNSKLEKITLFELGAKTDKDGDFKVQFRDLSID